jgi:hypothetical protein
MIIVIIISLVITNIVLATVIKDIFNTTWLNRLSLFPPFGILLIFIFGVIVLGTFIIDTIKDNWG